MLGDCELDVRFHIYLNVGSGCADCTVNGAGTSRCCDGNGFVGSCSVSDRCDNYFVGLHCLRETGSEGPCLTDDITSGTNNDTAFVNFQGQSISFERPGSWEVRTFLIIVLMDDTAWKIAYCFTGNPVLYCCKG